MVAGLDSFEWSIVVVAVSVLCHVTAAVWYTRKQRVYFQGYVDSKFTTVEGRFTAVDASLASVTQIPEVVADVNTLKRAFSEGLKVEIPDFKPQVREALTEWANGEKSKTERNIREAEEQDALVATASGGLDPDLVDAIALAGIDKETTLKLYRGARAVDRLARARGWGGPPSYG